MLLLLAIRAESGTPSAKIRLRALELIEAMNGVSDLEDALIGMLDDKDHLVQSHASALELLVLDHPFDEAQLRGASLDCLSHLSGVANRQADIKARMGTTKCDQVTWQPVTRNRLACLNN